MKTLELSQTAAQKDKQAKRNRRLKHCRSFWFRKNCDLFEDPVMHSDLQLQMNSKTLFQLLNLGFYPHSTALSEKSMQIHYSLAILA